jgi:FlaA1/EpsC-like NDP-sugar epimerase
MLDMGEPIRIGDLARDLIMLSNHSPEDIAISFTGLRPGEKIAESIRGATEKHVLTEHPRIVGVNAPLPAPNEVDSWYRRLEHAAVTHSPAIVEVLQEIISEYEPQNTTREIHTEAETFAAREMPSVALRT